MNWFLTGQKPLSPPEIEADPGQNVEIEEIKLYNCLYDFLGETFDKVCEYYGEPSYVTCIDGGGDLCWYETGSVSICFGAQYEEPIVDEIIITPAGNDTKLQITKTATSDLIGVTAENALKEDGFACEIFRLDDLTILQAVSGTGMVWYVWQSGVGNGNDLTKAPGYIHLYSERGMEGYRRE